MLAIASIAIAEFHVIVDRSLLSRVLTGRLGPMLLSNVFHRLEEESEEVEAVCRCVCVYVHASLSFNLLCMLLLLLQLT